MSEEMKAKTRELIEAYDKAVADFDAATLGTEACTLAGRAWREAEGRLADHLFEHFDGLEVVYGERTYRVSAHERFVMTQRCFDLNLKELSNG